MIAFLNWLDGVLWGVPLIALMILTGLYFTVRSGFFQFRHFGWIMKRTGGKLFQKEDKQVKERVCFPRLRRFRPLSAVP